MPYRDVAALLTDSAARDTQSARDSENIARLVDRLDYLLNFDYVGGTTDPDDPEVKRDRERRKAAGIKPPPLPILAPIALRDPDVTAELAERARAEHQKYEVPPPRKLGLRELMARYEGR
ncbi:hypothetical protein IRT45_34435 [Nocardia sp. BSTN01]|uniref:hypothetical protein n=1 Tax=Nocardia sp. BSTN01 TaxID=2783665 RepID=UPI0018902B88|nr:hypothetical protein [Nocardia sp. BSTN01]MBF5002217.1 hypothetical protein [Nocardia sp. BSTN01]